MIVLLHLFTCQVPPYNGVNPSLIVHQVTIQPRYVIAANIEVIRMLEYKNTCMYIIYVCCWTKDTCIHGSTLCII